MKKIASFLILFTIILSSCSSNDTTVDVTEADLLGTWELKEFYTENGTVSGTFNGFPVSGTSSVNGQNYNAQATFTNNPNKVTPTGNFTIVVTATIAGVSETIEQPVDQIPNVEGDWSVQNNILSVTEDGVTTSFSIISFSNTVLKLKTVFNEDIDVQGVNAEIQGDLLITLEK